MKLKIITQSLQSFNLVLYHYLRQHHETTKQYQKLEKKRPFFSRPCGQLVGLCPTCLFYSLRHGRLGLIEVFPFLLFFYSPRSITIVLPFGHQGLSLWSLRVFPLVIKVPHLHLHSLEVKCDERTKNEERTTNSEEQTYGPDGITNHISYIVNIDVKIRELFYVSTTVLPGRGGKMRSGILHWGQRRWQEVTKKHV